MSNTTTPVSETTRAKAIMAPATGQVIQLADIPDPVFSSGILGRGVAIRPNGTQFFAPITGELMTVMPHAYGIRGDDGIEVLVHIGIDTVELDGQHYTAFVATGQRVAAGDLLAEVDIPAVVAAGFDTITVVVVPNTAKLANVVPTSDSTTVTGATIITATV